MASPKKVCVVVLTRANYARIKCTLRAIREHPRLRLQLVVGGAAVLYRYGRVIDILERDGFTPEAKVYSILDGETPTTMAKSTGLLVSELATVFEHLAPDVVLTIADHFDTMATSIAATYMNIPLAHTQGGEVSGSIDESVRHAITKLAQIHFPSTERARQWIIEMGEDPEMVFLTGCPSMDAIAEVDYSDIGHLTKHFGGTGARVDFGQPYVVVLQHPVTTEYGQGLEQVRETLAAVHGLGLQAVWLWPNVDAGSDDISKGLRMFRESTPGSRIHFVRNMPIEDYARLIYHSRCLIGNSSSGIREAAFLGVPAVNIGTRQQNRERGPNVLDAGYDRREIAQAIERQVMRGRYERDHLYGDGRASQRIADILATVEPPVQKVLTYATRRAEVTAQ